MLDQDLYTLHNTRVSTFLTANIRDTATQLALAEACSAWRLAVSLAMLLPTLRRQR